MSKTYDASWPIFRRISVDGTSHKVIALIKLRRLAFGLCGELKRLKVGPARSRLAGDGVGPSPCGTAAESITKMM